MPFHFKLYVQGLLRIRLVGGIAAALCTAVTVFVPLQHLYAQLSRGDYMNIESIPPPYLTAGLFGMLLFAPLMVLVMFSFLNARNQSDAFHALGFRRSTMYVSFTAAIVTWVLGIVLANMLVGTLLWAVVPRCSYTAASVFYIPLMFFTASMMAAGAMMLAKMLTGTLFSNLALFGLLTVFVRVLGGFFRMVMGHILPMWDMTGTVFQALDIDFFLPYWLFVRLGRDIRVDMTPMLLYSLGVVAVMLAAAWLLFLRRPSEAAGRSAPSCLLQHIYRCALALPFAVMALSLAIISRYSQNAYQVTQKNEIIVLSLACVLVYFLYEGLSTRRWRNLLAALPVFLVVLAGAGLYGGGILLTREAVLSYCPSDEQIAQVSMLYENYGSTYEHFAVNDLMIDQPDARRLVAQGLGNAIYWTRDGRYEDQWSYHYGTTISGRNGMVKLGVRIADKSGKTVLRNILLSQEDAQRLSEAMMQSAEYEQALLSLPEAGSITHLWVTQLCEYEEDIREIWTKFCQEYDTLSLEEKARFKEGLRPGQWPEGAPYMLGVRGEVGLVEYYSAYPLDQLPHTFRLCVQKFNHEMDKLYDKTWREMIGDFIKSHTAGQIVQQEIGVNLDISLMQDGDESNIQIEYAPYEEDSDTARQAQAERVLKAIQCLEALSDGDIDPKKPFVQVQIDINSDGGLETRYLIANITPDTLSILNQQ